MSYTNNFEKELENKTMERTSIKYTDTPQKTIEIKTKKRFLSSKYIDLVPIEFYNHNWFGFSSLNDLYNHMESSIGYDK